jgi:undecaprenol kinase
MKKNSIISSFKNAFMGIRQIARIERNFKIELLMGVIAILLCAILNVSKMEWVLVLLCSMAVLSMECMNTALEKVVDLVSPEWHELARKGKDFAAGAVLLTAIFSAIIGMIIFLPYINEIVGLV